MSKKVLIVDDNPDDVFLLNRALAKCDVEEVMTVVPAAKAVDYVENLAREAAQAIPDVIFVDIEMKGVDGLEVVRTFKAQPVLEQVPIIVLSDRKNRQKRSEALALGASEFYEKPTQNSALIEIVRMVLQSTVRQTS